MKELRLISIAIDILMVVASIGMWVAGSKCSPLAVLLWALIALVAHLELYQKVKQK